MNKHECIYQSERSFENKNSDTENENLRPDSGNDDTLVVNLVVNPYESEPLANAAKENFVSVEDDADGLDLRTLEARFEGAVQSDEW